MRNKFRLDLLSSVGSSGRFILGKSWHFSGSYDILHKYRSFVNRMQYYRWRERAREREQYVFKHAQNRAIVFNIVAALPLFLLLLLLLLLLLSHSLTSLLCLSCCRNDFD